MMTTHATFDPEPEPAPGPEPAPVPAPAPARARLNPLALVSFVVALLGLGLAAVVLGHVALVQAGRAGERGRGFAIAGLVLGYLGVLLALAAWFGWNGYVATLRDGGYLPA